MTYHKPFKLWVKYNAYAMQNEQWDCPITANVDHKRYKMHINEQAYTNEDISLLWHALIKASLNFVFFNFKLIRYLYVWEGLNDLLHFSHMAQRYHNPTYIMILQFCHYHVYSCLCHPQWVIVFQYIVDISITYFEIMLNIWWFMHALS